MYARWLTETRTHTYIWQSQRGSSTASDDGHGHPRVGIHTNNPSQHNRIAFLNWNYFITVCTNCATYRVASDKKKKVDFKRSNLVCWWCVVFSPSEVQVPAIDYVAYFIRKDDGFCVLYIKFKVEMYNTVKIEGIPSFHFFFSVLFSGFPYIS